MSKVVLNHPRYKGEYPLDFAADPFTNLEWKWIKQISDYLPFTIEKGLAGGDPQLFVAFAVVALYRAGKIRREDALSAAESFEDVAFDGSIRLVFDEEDADVDPPAEPAEAPPTGPPTRSTGGSSSTTSAPPVLDLSRTGALA